MIPPSDGKISDLLVGAFQVIIASKDVDESKLPPEVVETLKSNIFETYLRAVNDLESEDVVLAHDRRKKVVGGIRRVDLVALVRQKTENPFSTIVADVFEKMATEVAGKPSFWLLEPLLDGRVYAVAVELRSAVVENLPPPADIAALVEGEVAWELRRCYFEGVRQFGTNDLVLEVTATDLEHITCRVGLREWFVDREVIKGTTVATTLDKPAAEVIGVPGRAYWLVVAREVSMHVLAVSVDTPVAKA